MTKVSSIGIELKSSRGTFSSIAVHSVDVSRSANYQNLESQIVGLVACVI